MIRKLIEFAKSDGLGNTMRFAWKGLLSAAHLYESETVCLYVDRSDVGTLNNDKWKSFSCQRLSTVDKIDALDFPRLKFHPYRKWIAAGGYCHVLFDGTSPVAFGWTHFNCHSIDKVGTFDMGDSIAWLGPSFVHKNYRGNGLQQLLLQRGIEQAPERITAFITSVNSGNGASLRSFEKNGFRQGAVCLFAHGTTEVMMMNDGDRYFKIV